MANQTLAKIYYKYTDPTPRYPLKKLLGDVNEKTPSLLVRRWIWTPGYGAPHSLPGFKYVVKGSLKVKEAAIVVIHDLIKKINHGDIFYPSYQEELEFRRIASKAIKKLNKG
jgi:hypothetical protein